ncbi:hypothetical protein TWF696_005293 [Orbilia brochopaga]|uniref:Histone deacetylase domain-containing protein n=1 Tax=Orbilia brochopaga TaxID=3140254 RepID=A0AAV9V497_9PEZI
MDRLLPSPSLNPDTALVGDLQKLSIGTHRALSSSPTSTGAHPSYPALIHKTSSLSGSLPNSPLRRKSSSPGLPNSPSTRPISRSPSMTSLSRLGATTPPAPPLPPLTHPDAETLVILNDTSYLHKFARPASKQDLETIVERPERLRAAAFGISVALCKLEAKTVSVIKTDRKGSLEDPSVTRVHDAAYLPVLAQACDESEQRIAAKQNELPNGWHTGDLYLCGGSRADLEGCVGALWEGVDRVFGDKNIKTESDDKTDMMRLPKIRRAFVSIRPPGHHCADTEPSGFCYLNNVHIAIARAALQYDLTHAVIFDFDLHHGDGSQSIAWKVNDRHSKKAPKNTPHIAYYSLHDINSYPCEYGDTEKVQNASLCIENAHNQNIWNVHLENYENSEDFWRLYEEKYSIILQKAERFLTKAKANHKPHPKQPKFKAGIFISAGFDASEHEQESMQRHKVNVLTEFYARFTSDAVELANTHAGGRVLSVLEGGYSDKAIWTGVFSHLCGLAAPRKKTPTRENIENVQAAVKLENGLHPRRSSLAQDITGKPFKGIAPGLNKAPPSWEEGGGYDSVWFCGAKLDEIDRAMQVVPSVRKPRDPSGSTYFSPTASSAAKVAATPRLHRKSSTNLADSATRTPSPPPPPPPLEWPAASAAVWRSILPEPQLAALREAALLPAPGELTTEKVRRTGKRHSAVGIPAVDIVTAASSRPVRNVKKTIPDIPERSGSALSSVAESQISRRTSMHSIKSSDTADTAITGVSQATSGRRKVSPPQKAAAATTKTAGAGAVRQTGAAKKTAAAAGSAGQPVKAPVRSSSMRQSASSSRKALPGLKTAANGGVKAEEHSVSPIEAAPVPSIKTTAEADGTTVDAITTGLQSIKLTYKNRERDEAEEIEVQRRLDEKELDERERLMEQQIAEIQAQKKMLLEKRAKGDFACSTVGNGAAVAEQVEQKTSLHNVFSQAQVKKEDGEPAAPATTTTTARPTSKGKPGPGKLLPKFTATSVIPFAAPTKSNPAPALMVNDVRPTTSLAINNEGAQATAAQQQQPQQQQQQQNGTSFRDRMAMMTPYKPKEKGQWEVGDEITPARAYKPAGIRTLPPHAPETPIHHEPRRVDADLKQK